jgi:hypothetical protein
MGGLASKNWTVKRGDFCVRISAQIGRVNLETAVEEGFRARKWPSQQGKEALWDEF